MAGRIHGLAGRGRVSFPGLALCVSGGCVNWITGPALKKRESRVVLESLGFVGLT